MTRNNNDLCEHQCYKQSVRDALFLLLCKFSSENCCIKELFDFAIFYRFVEVFFYKVIENRIQRLELFIQFINSCCLSLFCWMYFEKQIHLILFSFKLNSDTILNFSRPFTSIYNFAPMSFYTIEICYLYKSLWLASVCL